MSSRYIPLAGIVLLLLFLSILGSSFLLQTHPRLSPPENYGEPDMAATPGDKLGEVLSRGRMIIATDAAYPPNSELVPGARRKGGTRCDRSEFTADEFTGYNIAVATEVARRLGVEPCFVTPTRTEIISGSWTDRWDIHIGSMAITQERMKVLQFTEPYYAGPVSLFVNANNTAFRDARDLTGTKIGVCSGCILERYLEGTLEMPGQTIDFAIRNATIVAYENEAVALSDLGRGDGTILDAVLTNQPLGEDAIKSGMPLRQLGGPVFYDYDAAAVDRKSVRDTTSFVTRVSSIIHDMERDGTLLLFSQQYYGRDLVSDTARFDYHVLEPAAL